MSFNLSRPHTPSELRPSFVVLLVVIFLVPLEAYTTFQGASLNRYIMIILLAAWLLEHLQTRKPFNLKRPVWAFVAWLSVSLITRLLQSDISNSLPADIAIGYGLSLLLFMAVADQVDTRQRLTWVLSALGAGMLIFLGIWFITGRINYLGFFMPTGGASYQSGYANLLGAIVASLIAFALYAKPFLRVLAIIFMLPAGYLVFASGLRRSLFITAIVVVVLVAATKRPSFRRLVVASIISLGLYSAGSFLLPLLPQTIQQRFTVDQIIETGGSGRIDLSLLAINAWATSPVIGIGMGNFRYYSLIEEGRALAAHNMFLEVLAENGVIGFGFFIAGWLATLFAAFKAYRESDGYPDQLLAAVPFALSVAMLSGAVIAPYGNWRLLWVTFGLALASAQIIVPRTAPETEPGFRRGLKSMKPVRQNKSSRL